MLGAPAQWSGETACAGWAATYTGSMKSRLQLFLIFAVVALPYVCLTLFTGGTTTATTPASPALAGEKDRTVRRLFGVGAVAANIRAPKDKPIAVYAALRIENGKLVTHEGLMTGGDGHAELAWAKQEGKWLFTFSTPGAYARSEAADWMSHLRAGVNDENPAGTVLGRFEGFDVYGYAFSMEDRNGREDRTVSSSFETELARRKHMLLLAARFFATEAEMKKARTEFIDQMRNAAGQPAAQRADARAGQ